MTKKRVKKAFSKMTLEKERTVLADQRTLLSYVRTSLSIFIFGIFLIKFFPEVSYISTIFSIVMGIGILVLILGVYEYIVYKRNIEN